MMELTGLIILVVLVSIGLNGPGSQEARCRAEMRRVNRFLKKLRKERAKAQRP